MSLWSDFISNAFSRQAFKPTQYFTAYERHLSRFRHRSVTMIEIGVWQGGSLQMWKRYLGPAALIVGLDIDPKLAFEEPQIEVRIGDQGDPAFLQSVVDEFGPIDIVLDDGSHKQSDILATFEVLYPQLDRNGVYIVEDTGSSYVPESGGGLGLEGTFIEYAKTRIDELNHHYIDGMEPTTFGQTTMSIHIYDGIVVFERGQHVDRRAVASIPDDRRRESENAV